LTILAESCRSTQAYLYGMRGGRLVLLGAVPDAPAPADCEQAVGRYLDAALATEDRTQIAAADVGEETRIDSVGAQREVSTQDNAILQDSRGGLYPILLCAHEQQPAVVAVALLRFPSALRMMPPAALQNALAEALLEHDDVDPLTRLGA
jgi:hypothetical protein